MAITNLKKINQINIWHHQKDALKAIGKYFDNYSDKSFLLKMPTGTGKTGVFATLTRVAESKLNFLIVTPSSALKEQIYSEIKIEFWKKIQIDSKLLSNHEIVTVLPSTFEAIYDRIIGNFIVVTTIQGLQAIAKDLSLIDKYHEFRNKVDCIIFDEGHKEPALKWGETIRSYKKPTLLFSATPYRNDYKVFNVDKENFYSIEHEYCVSQKYLRQIVVRQINFTNRISDFLKELIKEVDLLIPKLRKEGILSPKIIIRCENSSDIEKIVNLLIKGQKRAIGIHENFKSSTYFRNEVPNSHEQNSFDYFVHQFKLVEGIDNPDFCILAIYSDFSNVRLLIQQIGRILRNPKRLENQFAYVFTNNKNKLNETWSKYLEHDKLFDSRKKLFDITDILKVNKEVTTLYFSGAFRELINVNNINLEESILFQRKLNVFINTKGIKFDDIHESLLDEWSGRDYQILKEQASIDTLLLLYIRYENSPLVKTGIFIEQTLCLTFLKFIDNHIYYYDTSQSMPIRKMQNLQPVSKENLLFLLNKKTAINKMYLINTDLGIGTTRSKELTAESIEATAHGLSDFSYFPSRMEASVSHNLENTKRYIGFQNGRITDLTTKRIEYNDFISWVYDIHNILIDTAQVPKLDSLMQRFAEKIDAPRNPEPISILLDIDEYILCNFLFDDNQNISIQETHFYISNSKFQVIINNEKFEFEIQYEIENKKFNLKCIDLEKRISSIINDGLSLIGYINAKQLFRLILKEKHIVYAHNCFFNPSINLISKKRNLDLHQLFKQYDQITTITSEKGDSVKNIQNNLWHKETLFGLISRQGKGYGNNLLEENFGFDFLVCDDLSNEIADFIGLDTKNKRVVFIHAKAKQSRLSASNFTEVCGQATKNLDYLSPFSFKEPKQVSGKWDKSWKIDGIGEVANRIIEGNCTGKVLWNKYIELMKDPNVSREVWIVVGGMFNVNDFNSELNKTDISKIKAEVIQLIYLLRSTWSSISETGSKLKIFC